MYGKDISQLREQIMASIAEVAHKRPDHTICLPQKGLKLPTGSDLIITEITAEEPEGDALHFEVTIDGSSSEQDSGEIESEYSIEELNYILERIAE